MSDNKDKTLRLLFSQWQGGDNKPYFLGSQLLDFLAPKSNGIQEEITVSLKEELETIDGIFARRTLLAQLNEANNIFEHHNPDKLIVLGGDCGVELGPISYMNDKYNGDITVLWIDAHPDTDNKSNQKEYHAHVLSTLLGYGDKEFTDKVPKKLKSENVLLIGLKEWQSNEKELIDEINLESLSPGEIIESSNLVLEWLKEIVLPIYIHLDLDVLDLIEFRSVLGARPDIYLDTIKNAKSGATFESIINLLQDVAKQYNVIGLGITEHFPWDAYALQNMLARLPLIGDINKNDKPSFKWRF